MHTDIFLLRFLKIYCGVFNCFRQKLFFFLKFIGRGKLLGSGRGAEFKKSNHKDGYKSELFEVQIAFLLGSSSLFLFQLLFLYALVCLLFLKTNIWPFPWLDSHAYVLFIILPDPNKYYGSRSEFKKKFVRFKIKIVLKIFFFFYLSTAAVPLPSYSVSSVEFVSKRFCWSCPALKKNAALI